MKSHHKLPATAEKNSQDYPSTIGYKLDRLVVVGKTVLQQFDQYQPDQFIGINYHPTPKTTLKRDRETIAELGQKTKAIISSLYSNWMLNAVTSACTQQADQNQPETTHREIKLIWTCQFTIVLIYDAVSLPIFPVHIFISLLVVKLTSNHRQCYPGTLGEARSPHF